MATSLKNNNTVSQSSSPTSEIDDMTTYDALLQYTMSQNHNKTQGQGNDGGSSLDLASSSVSDSIDNSANSGMNMNLNLNLQDFFFLNRNIDSMLAAQQGTLEQQSADIVDIPGVGRSKVSRRNSLPLAADLSTMFDDSDEGSVLSDTDNKERSSGENNDLQRVLLNDIWENQKKLDQIDVDSSTVAARSLSSPNSNTSNNNVASFRKALAQQARENSKPKSKQVPIPSLTPIDMKIINKNNDDEKKKKKISSTATTKKKRSSLTPGQTLVKSRANKLVGAMKQTQQSQVEIHQWDKKMGLRRSHSKTMRNTTRSRKKLQKMFGRTFKPTQFERFNPSIALVGNIALATNDSREKTESDSSKQKHNLYAKCA